MLHSQARMSASGVLTSLRAGVCWACRGHLTAAIRRLAGSGPSSWRAELVPDPRLQWARSYFFDQPLCP